MKTVVFDFRTPAPGDLVIVQYSSPRGGRTHASHRVRGARKNPVLDGDAVVGLNDIPADTPFDIARALGSEIGRSWMGDCFQAKVKIETGQLIVACSNQVSDVAFSADVEGGGGTTVEVTEF